MRVCFVYPTVVDPQTGGVERITHTLARLLEDRGHSVMFLACGRGDRGADPRQHIVPQELLGDSAELGRFVRSFLTEQRIDTVINQAATNIALCKLLHRAMPSGVRLVAVVHNSPLGTSAHYGAVHEHRIRRSGMGILVPLIKSRPASRLFQALYTAKYRAHYRSVVTQSDCVVVYTERYKHELSLLTGWAPSTRTVCIANPLDFEDNSNPQKAKEALYVGRLNLTQKRVDLLLRVWRRVQDRCPDWSLSIVGDGEDRVELETLAATIGLRNVTFVGRADPRAYYARASVFCMTSTYEGLPLVLIEAMHFGAVPLAFDSFGAARDIIEEGVDGCLVTPFRVDEYAATLSSLLADAPRRQRMATAAQQSSSRYSAKSIGESWVRLLGSIRAG